MYLFVQLHVLLDWIEATVNASKQSAADGIIFKYQDDKKEVVANKVNIRHLNVDYVYLYLQ